MLDSSTAATNANDVDDAFVVTRPLSFSKEELLEDSNDVDVDEPITTRLSGEDDNRWRFATCSSSGWAA
jgi:hypothetical protein